MAGFKVSKRHTMLKQDLRDAADGLASRLEREHGIRARWDGDTVRIKASGVDGKLSITDDVVEVSVMLGLLASPFKAVLQKEVQRYLDEHIS